MRIAGTAVFADRRPAGTEAVTPLIDDLKLRGLGEQTLLTLEIRDFDQLDAVVEQLTRR